MVPLAYLLGLAVVFTCHGFLMAVTTAGRKYTLFKKHHSWNEARAVCISSRMGMLKIASEPEMNGFKKVLETWTNDGKLGADIWTGLFDTDPTGADFAHYWQVDCTPLGSYTPWSFVNNEPDGKGTDNCVRTTKLGAFKTRGCDASFAVICQQNTDQCWYEEHVKKQIANGNLHKSAALNLEECKAMCLKTTTGTDECVAISHDGRVCSIYIAESIYIITSPTMTDDSSYTTLVKRCYDGTYKEVTPTVAENKGKLAENDCTTATSSSATTTTTTSVSTIPTSISPSTTTTTAARISTTTEPTTTTAETTTTTAETTTTTAERTTTTVETTTTTAETTAITAETTTTTAEMSSSSSATTSTPTTASTTVATTPTTVSGSDTTTAIANAITSAASTSVPITSTVSTTAPTTVSFTVTTTAATTMLTSASMTSSNPATTTVTEMTSVSEQESSLCSNSGSTPGPDNTTCAAICLAIAGPNSLEWQALMRALVLNRKMLSSYRRAKTSARDDRPSAGTLGASGIGILVVVFGSLVLLDLDRFVSMLHRAYKMPRGNKFRIFSLGKDI